MAAAHVTWLDRARQRPRRNGPIPFLASGLPPGRLIGPLTAARTPGVATTTRPGPTPVPSAVDLRVAEAARTALDALSVLREHALEIARAFRAEDATEARRGLRQLLQGTEVLVALATMTAELAGRDARSLTGRQGCGVEDPTVRTMEAAIAGDCEDDWTGVAATLEGPFTHALLGWRAFFESLVAGSSDPGPRPSAA